ncbi:hypothetical protein G7Y89_g9968 [Cudoniella acicularis]|uniref:NAD(P)-binding protein n=1 Tax=Cudoniella acicularis TaxID=354080 RepID=A0A8H4VZ62_9HELO|nr:hypothetical protein G7Y89_g9968 [Cudoniella acicularis]
MDRETLFDCTGLVVVITGGGTGLGLCMARSLAINGATVYILGRRLSKLEEAVGSCSSIQPPGEVIPLECDVTSKPSLEAAASKIGEKTGFVNLVIANAGVPGPSNRALLPRPADDPRGPLAIQEVQQHLWETSIDDFTEVFKINVTGALYTAVAFLDLLDKGNVRRNVKQSSQVIITSSIGGFHRSWTQASLAYTTSKAAVNHLVKSLASFLVQWKIRVNGLAPGLFTSEMMQAVFGKDRDLTAEGALPVEMQPLRRAGRDEEMAGTILYLASQAGAYCSALYDTKSLEWATLPPHPSAARRFLKVRLGHMCICNRDSRVSGCSVSL